MIRFVKGIYAGGNGDEAIIELESGLGVRVFIPFGSSISATQEGSPIRIWTSMKVREDDISLYGFDNRESLELFELLITVNGVGPKAGMSMMGCLSPDQLRTAVATEDVKTLQKADGVGKKTAERIILELKDKVGEISEGDVSVEMPVIHADEKAEAAAALCSLGYSRGEAMDAVEKVKGDNLSTEEYLKKALMLL